MIYWRKGSFCIAMGAMVFLLLFAPSPFPSWLVKYSPAFPSHHLLCVLAMTGGLDFPLRKSGHPVFVTPLHLVSSVNLINMQFACLYRLLMKMLKKTESKQNLCTKSIDTFSKSMYSDLLLFSVHRVEPIDRPGDNAQIQVIFALIIHT